MTELAQRVARASPRLVVTTRYKPSPRKGIDPMSTVLSMAPVMGVNPFEVFAVMLRSLFDRMLRPGLTVFATSDAGGGEGGEGEGGSGGEGGAGAAGGDGDGEGDDDLDDHAQLVNDLGEKGAREVIRLRRESARYRKERDDAASSLKAKTDAELSEAQREKARADEAEAKAAGIEAKAKGRLIRAEVTTYANSVGVVDADAVLALVDRDGIEVDDEDNVKGVKRAVDALLKAKPHLKSGGGGAGRSGADHGGGSGDGGGEVDMNALIRRQAGH